MFSTEGILKEIVKEKQEETNSIFSFSGCVGSFSLLPEASETNIGEIYTVYSESEYDMYVCTGLDWEKIDMTSAWNKVEMTLNIH